MAYREVTMIEIKEVLRRWVSGTPKKRIAAQLGLDPKTVRRYVEAAELQGVGPEDGLAGLTDDRVGSVIVALKQPVVHPHGDPWWACEAERKTIEAHLKNRLRLTKIHRLLARSGIVVPYSTLHRFAVQELGFGRKAATVPVADGEPGHELQVDTGWVLNLEPDGAGVRRRKKAFVFTPNVSRYRFVYPIEHETTVEAIAACEAAWAFYSGIFRVMVVDNMKAIVARADPLEPQINEVFQEYAQTRGFFVDAARVRRPKDKPRVERAVRDVRDDCFAGERLPDLAAAHARALRWCRDEYGMRRHSTTGRMPREHFAHVESAALLPLPSEPYDVPRWSTPKVARDHFAQVERALYSLPTRLIGRVLNARADRCFVRFYDRGQLVKICPRQPPGGRHIDPEDYPTHQRAYAMRDIDFLQKTADELGPAIGALTQRLLAHPLPWTRMRGVQALIALARRHGAERVDAVCVTALAHDMLSIPRLRRMLESAATVPKPEPRRPPSLARKPLDGLSPLRVVQVVFHEPPRGRRAPWGSRGSGEAEGGGRDDEVAQEGCLAAACGANEVDPAGRSAGEHLMKAGVQLLELGLAFDELAGGGEPPYGGVTGRGRGRTRPGVRWPPGAATGFGASNLAGDAPSTQGLPVLEAVALTLMLSGE